MGKQFERFTKITVWITLILFVARCLWAWQEIVTEISMYNLYGYAGEAVTLSAFLMVLYDKWIWRMIPLGTPVLKKQYSGTLKSSFDGADHKATLCIQQTFLSVHITMESEESRSISVSASLDNVFDEMRLTYCYLNEPKIIFRSKSEIHYGTAVLSVNDPAKISGKYYTDRCTQGDMVFAASK